MFGIFNLSYASYNTDPSLCGFNPAIKISAENHEVRRLVLNNADTAHCRENSQNTLRAALSGTLCVYIRSPLNLVSLLVVKIVSGESSIGKVLKSHRIQTLPLPLLSEQAETNC